MNDNEWKDPQDYEGGVEEMIEKKAADRYNALVPLKERKTTEVKVRSGDGQTEAELAMKFGYSRPIIELVNMTHKMYGYTRDANITEPLELAALKGINSLNDVILDAECLNRQGRYDEEELRAREWQRIIATTKQNKDEDAPDIDDLLDRWSQADAFMLQALIIEERDGIEAAKKHYPKFRDMQQQRDDVQMEASELPPAENMLFWCRVRQYKIMRERAYDLALGNPTHDFTDLKRQLAAQANVHDLVPEMPWTWREGYQLVIGSTADGVSFRETLTSLNAQEVPRQAMPWGMPPAGYYPPYMNGHEGGEGDEEDPDKRRAIFGLFGGPKRPQEPEKKTTRRRSRGRR